VGNGPMTVIVPLAAALGVAFAVRTGRRLRRTGEMPIPQPRV